MIDIYLNPHVSKSRFYANARMRNTPSVFTAVDKADHRRRRRVVGQAISERSMREFEPTMVSQVDVFLAQLLRSSQRGEAVEMTSRCKWLAIDVIGLLAFGCHWNTQTEEALRFIPKAMATINPRMHLFMTWPAFHVVDPGVQWLFQSRVNRFRAVLARMISDRMALPRDAKHDLYSFVASEEKVGAIQQEGLRGSEIWGEAGVFITAGKSATETRLPGDRQSAILTRYLLRTGGSTTATAICAAFFYLSRNPSAYAKLASEIRAAFSSGSDIRQGPRLASCKYLRAVIDESMRLSPPTPGVMWREQDPDSAEPLVVDGHVIPPRTLVGVGVYSLMHNPEYFPEPFAFRPERWLDRGLEAEAEAPATREARATMRRAFVPFAAGDRGCAGKAVAYLEITLTLAKTIWYFDFEAGPGKAGEEGGGGGGGKKGMPRGRDRPDEYQLYDMFMADHVGPNLLFRPRGNHWEQLLEASEK